MNGTIATAGERCEVIGCNAAPVADLAACAEHVSEANWTNTVTGATHAAQNSVWMWCEVALPEGERIEFGAAVVSCARCIAAIQDDFAGAL